MAQKSGTSSPKFDKLNIKYGQILSYARQGQDLENFLLKFLCVEFYCGHFEHIPDE
jgi:hypothetical protein